MEYKVNSPKLQDIQTATVDLHATANELGTIDGDNNLVIPVSAIVPGFSTGFTASNVFLAENLTLSEALSASIVGTDLVLDGSSSVSASNKIHLVLRLSQPM